MSILAWIEDQKRLKLLNAPKYVNPASDSSKGLWTRCDKCGVILYIKHLKENQRVCFGCSYHLQMSSQERVENLLDKDSWRPLDETVSPCDPLEFHDQKDYTDRLQEAQERTGLQDAIQTGSGMVDGIPIALGVMDFDFMGGSMGSVVGEKVTRLIEYATQEGLTLVLVCASGGARMQEGVFSLMQMAKISSALQVYQACANLLYISILTSPTTGGVTASFAMLGDIIFAEPKALVAFAGRRVIEQTLCEDLPEDFQTSEYMLHHGLLDLIVPRRFFRQALSESIRLYKNAPFKKPGRIPFGVQNPITFLVEEKIRRRWAVGNAPVADKLSRLWTESKGKDRNGVFTTQPPYYKGTPLRGTLTGRTDATPTEIELASDAAVDAVAVQQQQQQQSPLSVLSQRETEKGKEPQGHAKEKVEVQPQRNSVEMSRGSSQNIAENSPHLKDKESSPDSELTGLNKNGLNGSTKTVSSDYAQEIARTSASSQSKKSNKPFQEKKVEDIKAQSVSVAGDINKQIEVVNETQEKLAFKRAPQSVESAPLDASLQKDDSALIAPKVLQNRDGIVPISGPLYPLLQRETIDYRDILTSFQTMFNLFSKNLVVPYAPVDEKNTRLDEQEEGSTVSGIKKRTNFEQRFEQAPYEINSKDSNANSPQDVVNISGVSSMSDVLLHKFFTLSENQNSNQSDQDTPMTQWRENAATQTLVEDMSTGNISNGTNQVQAAGVSTPGVQMPKQEIQGLNSTLNPTQTKQDANRPSPSTSSDSSGVERSSSAHLEGTAAGIPTPTSRANSQAIEQLPVYKDVLPSSGTSKELVGSSSIYVDFLNQSIELAATESVEWRAFYLHQRISQTTGFIEDLAQSLPNYPKQSNEIAFQNMLFYRSICRKLS